MCSTLCNPIGYSPPGPSVHGILQARILEWVAISVSRTHIYIYGFLRMRVGEQIFLSLSLCLVCSMWDLTSPTRYWIHVPWVGSSESYTGPPEKSLRHHIFKPSSVLLILITQCCIANQLLQTANVYDISLSQESGHSLAGSGSHYRGIQTLS